MSRLRLVACGWSIGDRQIDDAYTLDAHRMMAVTTKHALLPVSTMPPFSIFHSFSLSLLKTHQRIKQRDGVQSAIWWRLALSRPRL